ncbi:hypothetical protein Droror1_Dr00002434 [Drosera rotundifolia]
MAKGDKADDDVEIPQPEKISEPLFCRYALDVSLYDLQQQLDRLHLQDEMYQIRMDGIQQQLADQTTRLGRVENMMTPLLRMQRWYEQQATLHHHIHPNNEPICEYFPLVFFLSLITLRTMNCSG